MSNSLFQTYAESLKQEILREIRSILGNKNCEEKILTREETAEYLKVNKSTLWNWHQRGELVPYGIGSRVYYKMSDILEALTRLGSPIKRGGVDND